ncbi:hypothetical protein GCM10020000_05590 [Streptomyces olivoverticillatus]
MAGVRVDWRAFFAGTAARRVDDLPTYAFQHERFWPQASIRATDASSLGLTPAEHPLLGAAMVMAGSDELVLTGTLSTATHPWLADHVVGGMVFFPGTGFLELAIRAADQAGCTGVEDLTLVSPLILPERGTVHVQLWVGGADDAGRREVRFHSRPANAADPSWTLHATGTLGRETTPLAFDDAAQWPPRGATEIDLDGLYERYAATGLEYGPVFRGLRAVWQRGEELYAEVALDRQVRDAQAFGIHPALLDAVLHSTVFASADGDQRGLLPFSWGGVSLHASGASVLRVKVTSAGPDTVRLAAVDVEGQPVVSVDSLVLRSASPQAAANSRRDETNSLFHVDWIPQPAGETTADDTPWVVLSADGRDLGLGAALAPHATTALTPADIADDALPATVLVPVAGDDSDVPESVHALTRHVLSLLQEWQEGERYAGSRLVFVTRGAVAAAGEGVADLAAAAVWGLVRSAQAENPGRFLLVDLDDAHATPDTLPGLAALYESDEPQAVLRAGTLRVGRLARLASGDALVPPGRRAVAAGQRGEGQPGRARPDPLPGGHRTPDRPPGARRHPCGRRQLPRRAQCARHVPRRSRTLRLRGRGRRRRDRPRRHGPAPRRPRHGHALRRLRPARRGRRTDADARTRGLVVGDGRRGAAGLPHRLLRHGRPGRAAARREGARARRSGRRGHGDDPARPPPRRRGLRHRERRQMGRPALPGHTRRPHRLLAHHRLRARLRRGHRRHRRRRRPQRALRRIRRRLPAPARPPAAASWKWARPTSGTPTACRTSTTAPSTSDGPTPTASGRCWPSSSPSSTRARCARCP